MSFVFGKYSSETPAKSFSVSPDPPTFHCYTPAKHDEGKRHIRVGLVCEYMTISMHTHTQIYVLLSINALANTFLVDTIRRKDRGPMGHAPSYFFRA